MPGVPSDPIGSGISPRARAYLKWGSKQYPNGQSPFLLARQPAPRSLPRPSPRQQRITTGNINAQTTGPKVTGTGAPDRGGAFDSLNDYLKGFANTVGQGILAGVEGAAAAGVQRLSNEILGVDTTVATQGAVGGVTQPPPGDRGGGSLLDQFARKFFDALPVKFRDSFAQAGENQYAADLKRRFGDFAGGVAAQGGSILPVVLAVGAIAGGVYFYRKKK